MKFSEALRRGKDKLVPIGGTVYERRADGTQCGCALGMAMIGAGAAEETLLAANDNYGLFYERWPYMRGKLLSVVYLRFDNCIVPPCGTTPTMTIDQLIAYVEEEEQARGIE